MLFSRNYFKVVANSHLTLQRLSNCTENAVDLNYTCYEKYYGGSSVSPVIILHGLLSSKNSWAWMSEAIQRTTGRKVINVDARNHGGSPHCPQNTYIHMAYDTVKLIKKLELSKVTLLGQSMGGRTAMTMSLLYPELVSSMILVDISPVSMSPQMINNFPHVLDAINGVDFTGVVSVDEATRIAREHLHESGITQKAVVDFILKNIDIKLDKSVGWIPNVKVLREDFPTLLKFPYIPEVFSGPTLFIKAGQTEFLTSLDLVVRGLLRGIGGAEANSKKPLIKKYNDLGITTQRSPEDLPGIKGYYPQAQLKYIPGVGHNIHEEDPSTLLKITTEFLIKYNF